jgi:hypothetical protein
MAFHVAMFLLGNQYPHTLLSDLLLLRESSAATALFVLAALRERAAGRRAFAAVLLLALAKLRAAASDLLRSGLEFLRRNSPFPSATS